MTDDTIIAFNSGINIPETGIYIIRNGSSKLIASRFPQSMRHACSYSSRAIDSVRFLYENTEQNEMGRYLTYIHMYDLSKNTDQLLASDACIRFISHPVSPDGKRVLLETWQRGKHGLAILDLATLEKTVIAMQGFILKDAVWSQHGKSIIATGIERPGDVVNVYRVQPRGGSKTRLWSCPLQQVNDIYCSPNGEYIIYCADDKLICESLSSGRKWKILNLKSHELAIGSIWTRNGRHFAALLEENYRTDKILLFDTRDKVSTLVKIGGRKDDIFPLGWLSDQRTFAVTRVREQRTPDEAELLVISSIGRGIAAEKLH